MAKAKPLVGRRFGMLVAVCPTEERSKGGAVVWECKCDCGNTVFVASNNLLAGNSMSCGCSHRGIRVDLSGRRFGNLTAVRAMPRQQGNRGATMWECRCDCGAVVVVASDKLTSGIRTSCGCLSRERRFGFGIGGPSGLRDMADGTSVTYIKSHTVPRNNTTGFRGVSFYGGKYHAYICFKGKQYRLGVYKKIEDAVEVRKKAETVLFDETVDFYARWKALADVDSEWAKANPVQICVQKDAKDEFVVSFQPNI